MMKCCIVGIGRHASANLIPALQRLQGENLIEIAYLCRNDITKGDGGLGVPVVKELPKDVDFLVACGHPNLHKSVIDFSNSTGKPNSVTIIDTSNSDDSNDVELSINLHYDDKVRTVNYTSRLEKFALDIVSNGETTVCKPYKKDSYYAMLKYFVTSNLKPQINNYEIGEYVLWIVNECLKTIQE